VGTVGVVLAPVSGKHLSLEEAVELFDAEHSLESESRRTRDLTPHQRIYLTRIKGDPAKALPPYVRRSILGARSTRTFPPSTGESHCYVASGRTSRDKPELRLICYLRSALVETDERGI
jgi:hypothetical protein